MFVSTIVVISFVKLLVNPFCKHEQLLFLAKLAFFFEGLSYLSMELAVVFLFFAYSGCGPHLSVRSG